MSTIPRDSPIEFKAGIQPTEQLVESAQQGCLESFRCLVIEHQEMVRLYLARQVRCLMQVDDLAQDVFVAAFSDLSKFRNESRFSTWLIGIAKYKCLQFFRTQSRDQRRKSDLHEYETWRQQRSRLEDAGSLREQERQIEAMQACVEQLPDKSRRLIDRFYFQHQNSSDIAASTEHSSSAIRMKLLRIRGVLLKCIQKKTALPESNDR